MRSQELPSVPRLREIIPREHLYHFIQVLKAEIIVILAAFSFLTPASFSALG